MKICQQCNKEFKKYTKYCSLECYRLSSVGHPGRNTGRTHFKEGHVPWHKGKKGLQVAWNRGLTGEKSHMFGNTHTRGLKMSYEVRERRRIAALKRGKENHPNWKGGITPINERIRKSWEYKEWRRHVFQRDDYTCQACGQHGGKLNADHELPFATFPTLRFEILNGRTLCVLCHRKTPTYATKALTFGI